ncbi:MAG: hypothetical protein MJE77_10555 [Proteobacteria bacterium]|nr:hypothetical protein [Pseudomonadota bacterium]
MPEREAAPRDTTNAGQDLVAELEQKIAQFVPIVVTADVSSLPERERKALDALIEASRLMEPIFDRQAYAGNPSLAEKLAADTSRLGMLRHEYFRIMRGPWDRQDNNAAFAVDHKRPAGAGFYPEDLTAEDFRAYLEAHPGDKQSLTSPYTVVKREGDKLVAVPYSQAYAEWLVPAAETLAQAAALTENATLAAFLRSRAAAFASNDYYQSDKDWMDLDSPVEITIGPYETYEDELMGFKASFESYVTVVDPRASSALAKFKALLPAMEQNLPVPDQVKTQRGAESPIRVVDLVFSAGDARSSVHAVAFNLPNDERVRTEKGAKKVILRNVLKAKFAAIMKPVGERVITGAQQQWLDADGFFLDTLFHELSHSLGPAFVNNDPGQGEVKSALAASYSAIEEGKADAMGVYNILYMIDQGHLARELRDRVLVTYFAGLFRSVRFGITEAHGQGAALQINYYLEANAVTFDPASGLFTVNLDTFPASITALVREMCLWQHNGDKPAVDAALARYGKPTPIIERTLARLGDIPVDIRPSYPLAGE